MNIIPQRSLFDFDDLLERWSPFRSSDKDLLSLRVDIKDKEDCYEISADLPGVKREDIQVTLRNGMLNIEAETRQEDKEEKDGKIIRQERRYGKFLRSFEVGNECKEADIKATFKDGVLTVTAPKMQSTAPPTRSIEIK